MEKQTRHNEEKGIRPEDLQEHKALIEMAQSTTEEDRIDFYPRTEVSFYHTEEDGYSLSVSI